MIIKTDKTIEDLEKYILEHFAENIENIEEDIETTKTLNPVCYTFEEDAEIIGFICVIYTDEITFMSYTLSINNKVMRTLYKHFKKIHAYSAERNIPVITDGTNFDHCKNHVVPYKVVDGRQFWEWKL